MFSSGKPSTISLNNGADAASLSKLAVGGVVGAAVAAGGLFYASRVEPDNVEVKEVSLVLPRLSPEFDGYRIAQISDIHMDGWMSFERLSKLAKLVNEQGADLIAATGDFVTAKVKYVEGELTEALAILEAPDGVAAVLGNHDYIADGSLVRRVIKDAGLVELSNDFFTLERGEGVLHVAGIDNFYQRRARLDLVLSRLPEEGAAVLLAHEPDFAEVSAPTGRFDLQMSGHSHGGQMRLPIVGAMARPRCGRIYPDGVYDVDGMIQYTNRGLGMLWPHLRINCRPEITVLTLRTPAPNNEKAADEKAADEKAGG
jgi:predicted MPP superfamily phosphohydrolase